MSGIDSWLLAPLRKAAMGGTFTVVGALRGVSLRLHMHAAQYGDEAKDVALWVSKINEQVARIEAAPTGEQYSTTTDALKTPSVRKALEFMVRLDRDADAQTLLDYDADTERRYDGDAAQQLLKLLARRANSKDRAALEWLAQQPPARHAFAPKDVQGNPPTGMNGEDLSRPHHTPDERLARKYADYLAERFALLARELGIPEDGSYTLTDKDEARADKLWRSAQLASKTSNVRKKANGAMRKRLSTAHTAWNKLHSPVTQQAVTR